MKFNIGDARDITNFKTTCTIMKETAKKFNEKEYYNYGNILKNHVNEIRQDELSSTIDRIKAMTNYKK